MSQMETSFILARLRRAERKWSEAVCKPGYPYPDEPTPEKPFTAREFQLYCWADAWRDAYHKYEGLLYKQPDVRHGMVEGLSLREDVTYYERIV